MWALRCTRRQIHATGHARGPGAGRSAHDAPAATEDTRFKAPAADPIALRMAAERADIAGPLTGRSAPNCAAPSRIPMPRPAHGDEQADEKGKQHEDRRQLAEQVERDKPQPDKKGQESDIAVEQDDDHSGVSRSAGTST